MALKRNMPVSEMVWFIDNELLPQVKHEIKSWIMPTKRQGGYFVVVRQTMCMIDFLGALNAGYPKSEKIKDPNGIKIATSEKAIAFITEYFRPKWSYKIETATKLYSMYRHGLVHLYQPKILRWKKSGKLMWFFLQR